MTLKERIAMKTLRFLLVAMLAVGITAPRVATAQAPSRKALVITAKNLTAGAARNRSAERMAHPGDEIRYTLVFTNVTKSSVKNVQFVDPIPQGLVYVLGSAAARQPVRVEYSIDGGKAYAEQPMVDVMENGKTVQKPAPRERYTHVRWTVLDAVAPGAQVTAEFRAQVNTAPGEAK
jgi:uncharacterized repeat protein (TIGR01451 family)